MRYLVSVWLVVVLAVPALAQSAGGLSGALDRQEQQQGLQQSEIRRENQLQRQELQRQLDQLRIQQSLERQPVPPPPPVGPCTAVGLTCN